MGFYDSNGIYIYTEDDQAAPFSDLLNLGQESASDEIANDRARLTALEGRGARSNWVPTWNNLVVGNGTVTAYYTQIGKLVVWQMKLIFGSSTDVTNTINMALPTAVEGAGFMSVGGGFTARSSSSAGRTLLECRMVNATLCQFWTSGDALNAAPPMGGDWIAGDVISVGGTYFAP